MTGICHTQLLQSVALIEWDHMLLAGKDQGFFSTLFRKLLEIFHKLSGDPLMTVFRDHVQSEYSLDLPVLSVKSDIMIKFIREYWFICGSSVDKTYDLLILYCYNEIFPGMLPYASQLPHDLLPPQVENRLPRSLPDDPPHRDLTV